MLLGARLPRLVQLHFAAPLAKAQTRSARPLQRSLRRHLAQCLGGFKLNENAKKPAGAAGPAPEPKRMRRPERTTHNHERE